MSAAPIAAASRAAVTAPVLEADLQRRIRIYRDLAEQQVSRGDAAAAVEALSAAHAAELALLAHRARARAPEHVGQDAAERGPSSRIVRSVRITHGVLVEVVG